MWNNGLETGVFTISLDFELIWGTLDKHGPDAYAELCRIERSYVIDSLLELFAEFDVSATWCTVGHLFLRHCCAESGLKHANVVRPRHAWVDHDWFSYDPCGTEETAPLFYGRSLVDKILACRVPQEVGCHSFSHVIFADPGCSRATAESELQASARAAQALGIELHTFAFPRNCVGHLDVLRANGFTCFRSPEPRSWNTPSWPRYIRRAGQLYDILTIHTPPAVMPELDDSGLWKIPASMLYTPSHGLRRHIPVSFRVRRACKGLDEAVRNKKIFHLWFHPTDLAANAGPMLAGLRQILEYSDRLRTQNRLRVLPMGALVPAREEATLAG